MHEDDIHQAARSGGMKDLRIKERPKTECDYFRACAIDLARRPNDERISKCGLYIQRASYDRPFVVSENIDDMPHRVFIGVIIYKDKKRVLATLQKIDWLECAPRAMNGSRVLTLGDVVDAFEEAI